MVAVVSRCHRHCVGSALNVCGYVCTGWVAVVTVAESLLASGVSRQLGCGQGTPVHAFGRRVIVAPGIVTNRSGVHLPG